MPQFCCRQYHVTKGPAVDCHRSLGRQSHSNTGRFWFNWMTKYLSESVHQAFQAKAWCEFELWACHIRSIKIIAVFVPCHIRTMWRSRHCPERLSFASNHTRCKARWRKHCMSYHVTSAFYPVMMCKPSLLNKSSPLSFQHNCIQNLDNHCFFGLQSTHICMDYKCKCVICHLVKYVRV